jgi:cytochrome c-type biogenesis protein CcmH
MGLFLIIINSCFTETDRILQREILMNLKKRSFEFSTVMLLTGVLIAVSGCNKNDAPVGSAPAAPAAQGNYGQPPAAAPPQMEASTSSPAAAAGTFSGTIFLDPKLAGKVDPNAVLFISAKPAEGPQMGVPPVASQRVPSPKFPLQYTLSQVDVIMPGATLSGQFNIVVKLMKNGAAGPMGPGDIEGKFSKNPVASGGKGVDVTLDTLH